jgi:hypothetical protein
MNGSCGSFDDRDTDATNDRPLSATQQSTSCRTSLEAKAFDSVPVGEAGDDAKENEHADMDSKDERAFVGEPIELVSEVWLLGDMAERSSEATDEVGDCKACTAFSLVFMRCFLFFFRARTTFTSRKRTNLPRSLSEGST